MLAVPPSGTIASPSFPGKPLGSAPAIAGALALVGAGLIGWHAYIHAQGPRWASPLRVGDWFFNLGLGLGLLALAWSIG